MRYRSRLSVALFLMAALSTVARAGPIQWGYRAVDDDGTVLAERTGITDPFWSDYFLSPKVLGTKLPEPNPGGPTKTDIWRHQATVILTDELSGDTASLPIFADYIEQYEIKPDGSLYPIFEGEDGGPFWPTAGRFDIGGNVYRVRTPGGELQVRVEPGPSGPPVQTPEPASLALAGLGLGAVLLRRVRKARGALVALLVCFGLCGTASAGPIQWNYRATFATDGDGILAVEADFPLVGGNIAGVPLRPGVPSGTHFTSQEVRLGSVRGSEVVIVGPNELPPVPLRAQFLSEIVVTDVESGEEARVTAFGRGRYVGDLELSNPLVLLELTNAPRGGQFVLGNNRYTIFYEVDEADLRETSLVADVTVQALTPEPASLALAGIGLGAVLLRRKKWSHRGDRRDR